MSEFSNALANWSTAALVGLFTIAAVYFIVRFSTWALRQSLRWRQRLETRAVARGERGVMAALSLYRERVIDRLATGLPMGLESFSLDKMYVPLDLEVPSVGGEPAAYRQAEAVVQEHSRVVILGPPGAGKTTTLRHVELVTARGEVPGLPDLPLFMPVRELVGDDGTFSHSACRVLASTYGIHVQPDELTALLRGGMVLVLLDGLDEVGVGSGAYDRVLKLISAVAEEYASTHIVLSCRTAAWTSRLPNFREANIVPLDEESIRRFIVARFRGEEAEEVERLHRIISSTPPFLELARNPLFLSLMVAMDQRRRPLPRSRLDLYQQCSELLLFEWDSVRGITRETQVSSHLKFQLLKRLGVLLQREHSTAISKERLAAQVAEWFPTEVFGPPEAVLLEIAAAHGLLVTAEGDSYAFVHITFQHYFAALGLSELRPLPDFLLEELADPWWTEVALLLSAKGRVDEIVGVLMDVVIGPEPLEDYSGLLLAADCVADSPSVDPAVRQDVLRALARMFHQADDDGVHKAAMAMAGLGDRQVEEFLQDRLSGYIREIERVSAALGLAELGRSDSQVVDVLVESLGDSELQTRIRAARALGRVAAPHALDAVVSVSMRERSPQARAEMIRAINSMVDVGDLDTGTLALTIKALRAARQDRDPVVSGLASEVLRRLGSRVQE